MKWWASFHPLSSIILTRVFKRIIFFFVHILCVHCRKCFCLTTFRRRRKKEKKRRNKYNWTFHAESIHLSPADWVLFTFFFVLAAMLSHIWWPNWRRQKEISLNYPHTHLLFSYSRHKIQFWVKDVPLLPAQSDLYFPSPISSCPCLSPANSNFNGGKAPWGAEWHFVGGHTRAKNRRRKKRGCFVQKDQKKIRICKLDSGISVLANWDMRRKKENKEAEENEGTTYVRAS